MNTEQLKELQVDAAVITTERSCVVAQSLRQPATFSISRRA